MSLEGDWPLFREISRDGEACIVPGSDWVGESPPIDPSNLLSMLGQCWKDGQRCFQAVAVSTSAARTRVCRKVSHGKSGMAGSGEAVPETSGTGLPPERAAGRHA